MARRVRNLGELLGAICVSIFLKWGAKVLLKVCQAHGGLVRSLLLVEFIWIYGGDIYNSMEHITEVPPYGLPAVSFLKWLACDIPAFAAFFLPVL